MMSLIWIVLSCRTKLPAGDSGDLYGPGDTYPHSGLQESAPDSPPDSEPIEAQPFVITPACPYEDPPTVFTGGLVWVNSLQGYNGPYIFEIEGYFVTKESGDVDWDAGTITATREHIPGYSAVSSTSTASFTLQANGDSVSASTTTTLFSDGAERSASSSGTKTGCVSTSEILDTNNGDTTLLVRELVSATQVDWVEETWAADGVTQRSMLWGTQTSDWTDTYSFEKYDPNTEREVDQEGDCSKWGDGTRRCDITVWNTDGYLLNTLEWAVNGDNTATWETWQTEAPVNPSSFGVDLTFYLGGGSSEWSFWDKGVGAYVECSGSWDSEGLGTWSCTNGNSGSYTDK